LAEARGSLEVLSEKRAQERERDPTKHLFFLKLTQNFVCNDDDDCLYYYK